MSGAPDWKARSQQFCDRFGGEIPLLLAPMAGACPPELSIGVMQGGGWGAAGALLMPPEAIAEWCARVRSASSGPFQLNLWIPDEPPPIEADRLSAMTGFLGQWSNEIGTPATRDAQDFAAQCEAMIAAAPAAISSIMGVYPAAFVARLKSRGIPWFAIATTVAEARESAAAGADAIIAQGMEAGGHRGAFQPGDAERAQCGLFALLPAIVDAVDVPVIATGGIADARTAAAAFLLGASAIQIGTGFLRAAESDCASAWRDALAGAWPEDTQLTRALTGRAGRALRTGYVVAADAHDAPPPMPYPIQRSMTQPMTRRARADNDLSRMQAWAGQSARLAPARPASEIAASVWQGVNDLLG